METITINPVILIGGSGTRLWPMSRVNYPKQFNKFLGDHSLFQQTLLRLSAIQNCGKIILVVGESNYFLCLDQLRELSIDNVDIIVEPIGKNTAPAVAVAAEYICQNDNDNNLMLVLPSDHQIKDTDHFIQTVHDAMHKASEKLVLFGVVPNSPATGYGYIQAENSEQPAKVAQFIEKPSLENAELLIQKPNCFWNSGMFFFSAKAILREMQMHAPEIDVLAKAALSKAIQQGNTCYLHRDSFSAMPNIPLDIAIMEKTNNAYVFPLQSDWSDLGDWNAVYQTEKADEQGNVAIGNVLSLSTKNSYLHSNNKLLTTIGIDNLVVVSAKDSVLIADKNKVQDVKALVDLLKSGQYAEHAHNDLKVHRPWGSYESVINMDNFQVKHIVVKPGGTLSLQLHYHRSEHWIVVKGIAEVICGENAYQVHENQSTYIPKETKHRLVNLQSTPLHLIEVQVGSYLGEDDIVRYDDVYGRADVRDSVDVA
ncbi:MAG: mannose-1-phosphate guanylyltransferase/mannose-6-phosphate isomerase [Gammaproteobacteria bacterium RIFCSPHIGHO2_12_FULL_40_19]|nr:MAG: mannose-1-phosphate guanylyltransferase/mannose-6-phosphate isomerase [Gammaproteobacteria bacterium RIFCSPHIGHO2_12_FULL_40_19]